MSSFARQHMTADRLLRIAMTSIQTLFVAVTNATGRRTGARKSRKSCASACAVASWSMKKKAASVFTAVT